MAWRLDIEDKVEISSEDGKRLVCPTHHIPHKLPILTKPICDENCHYHNSRLRMLHHIAFCYYISCPNRRKMLKKYSER
jgi:hypothetical protein